MAAKEHLEMVEGDPVASDEIQRTLAEIQTWGEARDHLHAVDMQSAAYRPGAHAAHMAAVCV